ncbi:MAG: hypothetical protein WC491_04395 [Candidatus Omnitrophota bacterium]
MKIDTKFIVGLLIMLLYLTSNKVYSEQGGGRPPMMTAEQMVSDMKKSLGLSEEQASQILPIVEQEMEKREELMGSCGGPGNFESMRSSMEKIDSETETALAQYLTDEQMAKWKKIQKERKSKMGRGPGGGGGGPPGMQDQYR